MQKVSKDNRREQNTTATISAAGKIQPLSSSCLAFVVVGYFISVLVGDHNNQSIFVRGVLQAVLMSLASSWIPYPFKGIGKKKKGNETTEDVELSPILLFRRLPSKETVRKKSSFSSFSLSFPKKNPDFLRKKKKESEWSAFSLKNALTSLLYSVCLISFCLLLKIRTKC